MEQVKGLSTRERRRERTKAMILQSAEELLAEGGLQNLTLVNIAHRAAYSKPAIYEYFNGLEDILHELSNAGFIRLGENVRSVSQNLAPEEAILAVCHAFLKFASENSELYQLMFTHIIFTQAGLDARKDEPLDQTEASYRVALEIIEEGIRLDVFKTRPGFDSRMMLYMCWITLHGMASLKKRLVEEVNLDVERNQAEMLHILINNLKGILPGEEPA